ncbi:MAG: hypothetical protein KME19_25625 [Microcoleus vaginatus WJT46-NPBG5]|nr:hypothetical protein [Microcoleus vaginatus WJT46-NPBG5]
MGAPIVTRFAAQMQAWNCSAATAWVVPVQFAECLSSFLPASIGDAI